MANRAIFASMILWMSCLAYAGATQVTVSPRVEASQTVQPRQADQAAQPVQAAQPAQTGQTPQTVWSGVYTDAQAYRGEKIAQTTCIGCHGSGLDGGDSGPKLTGGPFLENWSSQPVSQLFDWIREAMPSDAPGTLSKDDAAAVVAYILKINKMPAGKQELPTDREFLDRIGIVAEKP
jgi:mono/diheme cytochrome c family protein